MQKLYYSISEICEIVDEEQHILRYWEKEFDLLKPKKNRSGNRIYSEKDLIIIKLIKKLIRGNKLSLKGAKEQLKKILENENISDAEPELAAHPETKAGRVMPPKQADETKYLRREELVDIYNFFNTILDYLKKN